MSHNDVHISNVGHPNSEGEEQEREDRLWEIDHVGREADQDYDQPQVGEHRPEGRGHVYVWLLDPAPLCRRDCNDTDADNDEEIIGG